MEMPPTTMMAGRRCIWLPMPWEIAAKHIRPFGLGDALKSTAECPNFEQRPDASLPGMRMRRA